MALLVPNVGEGRMIRLITNSVATTGENIQIRLFKSNTTPTSTMTSFTTDYVEATFTGYVSVAATSASWNIVEGAPTSATQSAATTFTCTAATSESIYGYYLTQATSSILLWSERFSDGPYVLTNNGDKIILTAVLTVSTT
jgi:hypothetical protein